MTNPWLDPYNRDLTPGMTIRLEALFAKEPVDRTRLRKTAKKLEAMLERGRSEFSFGDIFETRSSQVGLADWLVTQKYLRRQRTSVKPGEDIRTYVFHKTPYTWGLVRYLDPDVPKDPEPTK